MAKQKTDLQRALELRNRAASKLNPANAPASAAAALSVLHGLALSPATAADAMALLHELQVHQVELDLQYDELRSINVELEASLNRQIQLYDVAPVGLCTIDRSTQLFELNLTAARLLGHERDALLGRALLGLLAAHSRDVLNNLLERVGAGMQGQSGVLELVTGSVHATAAADPCGERYFIAFASEA